MHVQENPPRSPFAKGEGELFVREMVSSEPPLSEPLSPVRTVRTKGGWGDLSVDLWIAPPLGAPRAQVGSRTELLGYGGGSFTRRLSRIQ